MYLLIALRVALFFAIAWLLVTQVIFPLVDGRRLFPAFRKNPLAAKVVETREEVGDLAEQVENLEDLVDLTKNKTRLEQELQSAAAALRPAETEPAAAPPTAANNQP